MMIMNEPREQSPRNGAVAESSRALAECLSFLDEGDPAYRDCSLPRYDHSHGKREGEGRSLHPQALGEGPPLQQVCSQRKPAWVRCPRPAWPGSVSVFPTGCWALRASTGLLCWGPWGLVSGPPWTESALSTGAWRTHPVSVPWLTR